MFKVLVPRALSGTGVKYLQEKGCQILTGTLSSADDPRLFDCHAILTGAGSRLQYDKTVLDRCENCKVISNFSAGFEHIDVEYAKQKGIIVTNAGTANSNAVAEQTLLLMLACAKNHQIMSDAAHKGNFSIRRSVFNMELEGAVLGLIGYGKIGSLVAKKALHGFGMKVLVYGRHLTQENAPEGIIAVNDMNEIYKNSDFVSLHVPLTEQNKYMVTKNQFDLMKPSAYIINVSRGGLIKETDLIQALKEKKISGAGLDVFEQEPLPVDSPLFDFDHIILSPHSAANTVQALNNMELFAAEDIWRVLNGEAPEFPVNNSFHKI